MKRFLLLVTVVAALFAFVPGHADPPICASGLGYSSCVNDNAYELCAWTYAHAANLDSCTQHSNLYTSSHLWSDDYTYYVNVWGTLDHHGFYAWVGDTYVCGNAGTSGFGLDPNC